MVPRAASILPMVAILVLILAAPVQAKTTPPPFLCEVGARVTVSSNVTAVVGTGNVAPCDGDPRGYQDFDGRWLVWAIRDDEFYTVADVQEQCIRTNLESVGALRDGIMSWVEENVLHVLDLATLRREEVEAPEGTELSILRGGGDAFRYLEARMVDGSRVWVYDGQSRAWTASNASFLGDDWAGMPMTSMSSSVEWVVLRTPGSDPDEARYFFYDVRHQQTTGPAELRLPDGAWEGPISYRGPVGDRLYLQAMNLTNNRHQWWSVALPDVEDETQWRYGPMPLHGAVEFFIADREEALPTWPGCPGPETVGGTTSDTSTTTGPSTTTGTIAIGALVLTLLLVVRAGRPERPLGPKKR